jgi:hypothetical protein
MIKNIGGDAWINVFGGGESYPYLSGTPDGALGQVRWNAPMNNFETFYNGTWHRIPTSAATVTLSGRAQEVLMWAEKKMLEDKKLEELASKHPAVKDLKEKLELTVKLVEKHSHEDADVMRSP